jgi:PAS domain S-box-containing protein
MNHSENRKPELLRKILMAMAFAALGYLGNYLSIQVAFSVAFIFGSIFAVIAVAIMGLWWGIGVSVIASSYTYQLWNHPYAIIIFTAEIIWIGLALRRGKKNILLIDSLYWLILGMPLVIAFYSGVQQLDAQSVTIIALKQALNGVFNAMAASIILSHTPLRKWTLGVASTGLPTYSTIIFHLVSVSLMVPSLGLLLYMNHREAASQQSQTVENLQVDAYEARAFIQAWVGSHVNAARVIASLGEKYPLRPSPRLQEELLQIHKLFPDYHNVFLGDANATTIAFCPPINERGESTIGINFADRAWFKQLENTLKPVVSDVFMGRGGIFAPTVSISVPVVRDEKLVRFGLGAVNLEKLSGHLATFSRGDTKPYSLVDRNGNLIVSSDKTRKPLTPVAGTNTGTNKGTVVNISQEVSLWVPGTVKNVSIMNVWKGSYYFMRLPIDETNWTLLTQHPVAPMQKYLYSLTIWGLGGGAALYALSILLALILSRRLARTSEALSVITKDIPVKIDQQDMIVWPDADTAEMQQLTNNFKDTESALRKYIQEVRQANAVLEQRVQERTLELQSERQRLGDILYGTNAGTWEWNVQTGETSFNERWANIIGYGLNELEPVSIRTWIDFAHPDDLKASNELLEKHFKGEIDYYEYECRMKHKDGHWIWVLDRGKVVFWTEDGKPLTMSGTHQDITERRRAEEQVRHMQKTESLGRMAGAIAHHFNNQLGVVIGNLEMIIDGLPQGAGEVHSLTAAMRAAQKAAEMSGLMLTYLGQSFDKRESLDLSETCLRSLPILRAAIRGKVALETALPTPGPVVSANANQIQQILTNLITNAWEAIGDGQGSIYLNVKAVSPQDIPAAHRHPINWQPQDHVYACLEVADTGGGIADKDIEKIFDPFFSSKFTGRGLGLAVVLGIVKAHDGAITVESEPGQGSVFRVFLPVSAEEFRRQPDKAFQPLAIEASGAILLVDDEEMVRDMAAIMLKRLGYSVLEAKDGGEALEVFRQRREEIRLVLCDLTMPRMDGWETLTALRKLDPDVPVILASGYDEARVMAGDHPERPEAFLGKPYKLKELGDAIGQALVSRKK